MFTTKIIPVIVINDASKAKALGETLVQNKLPIAEVTLRTEAALASIKAMSEVEGLVVGAGTVLTVEQAKAAVEAGASFLVSPGLHVDVVEYAKSVNVAIIPGTTSATEIASALALGVTTVKFFPAEAAGGPKLLKALSSVYPHVSVMPTGGINPSNLHNYLSIKTVIGCGGSWMVPADLVDNGDFDALGKLITEAVELSEQPA